MPVRFRIYRWFKEGWAGAVRFAIFLALSFIVGAAIGLITDLLFVEDPEYRWGLTVFYAFVTGFTLMCIFPMVVELLGLGYGDQQPQTHA